jgi:FKBP-type peptidyl-prolyl cis-trans isomerase
VKTYSATASASGTHVSNGGGALPTVSATTGQAPTITIPKKTAPPNKLVVTTLIKGSGPPITKGEEVVTQYVGVIWRTGGVFDSSWSRGAPFGFQIGASPSQIIPGWDTGLLGVPVGSRVMLVIPPKDGYGSSGESSAGIKGTDTLVFVVDILDAVNGSSAS